MKIIIQGGASVPASRVPPEQMETARHFNTGVIRQTRQVPEGRPETSCDFSRPCGTSFATNLFPALKRRAIFRTSLRDWLIVLMMVWLSAFAAKAETTNGLSDAEIKGRELARQLSEAQPAGNFTNTGVLQIRNDKHTKFEIPITIETILNSTNWLNRYAAKFGSNITDTTTLVVTHDGAESNRYLLFENDGKTKIGVSFKFHIGMGVSGNRTMIPFAGSDFWLCDLGLEFFHWPEQKVLPKTTNLKRGRSYTLLESTNPNPGTNGYSRVVTWIDQETGGILEAEAYDTQGKLLKVFEPKSFKKVNGQWELQEMEIRNVQTGSRTRIEFDLKK